MRFNASLWLSYAWVVLPYVVALSLGLLVPLLAVVCYSGFGAGVAVVAVMFAFEALYMFVGGISLGVSLFYTDIVLAFVFVTAMLRLVMDKSRPALRWSWICFCAVALLSLATGLLTYGAGAGVQARPYFYFVAAALYGMSFRIDAAKLRVVFNAAALLVALLLCITAYRWVVYYTPITVLLPPEGVYNNDGPTRVIRSYEALVIAEVLVVSLFFVRAARGLWVLRVLSPLAFAAVLVLQHRSVWATALAGIFASVMLARLRRGSAATQIALLACLAITTALPMIVSDKLSGVSGEISSSAGAALGERGSAGERLSSWKEIVNNWAVAGPRSIAIGQSFGTDPARFVKDDQGVLRKLEYTAHNMYVQTLFNTGLIGLGSFVLTAVYVVRGLYRLCASGEGGVEAQALLVLVLMQLVYYVPYGTDYLQSLIFGVALSYVAGQPAKRALGPTARSHQSPRRADGWGWT